MLLLMFAAQLLLTITFCKSMEGPSASGSSSSFSASQDERNQESSTETAEEIPVTSQEEFVSFLKEINLPQEALENFNFFTHSHTQLQLLRQWILSHNYPLLDNLKVFPVKLADKCILFINKSELEVLITEIPLT
jgi:hypothetical protein